MSISNQCPCMRPTSLLCVAATSPQVTAWYAGCDENSMFTTFSHVPFPYVCCSQGGMPYPVTRPHTSTWCLCWATQGGAWCHHSIHDTIHHAPSCKHTRHHLWWPGRTRRQLLILKSILQDLAMGLYDRVLVAFSHLSACLTSKESLIALVVLLC